MKWPILALTAFSMIPGAVAQDSGRTIRVDVVSSFVWGEDAPAGATSSTIKDPLTGSSMHRLSYGEIEVTSHVGFEGIDAKKTGTFLSYTTTIANSKEAPISVRFGGFIVDGKTASPLEVVLPAKKQKGKAVKDNPEVAVLNTLYCFADGFLSRKNFFSANASSQVVSVPPQTSLSVSAIVRDPRDYGAVLCSTAGCYPTGTIRYALNVDGHDYIFTWPGRSAMYCGK
jgi:hypothetical protein